MLNWLGANWLGALTVLVATGSLALSFYVWRRQVSLETPSVFVKPCSYQNGVSVEVTVRNRAQHPLIFKSIEMLSPDGVKLAPVFKKRPGLSGAKSIFAKTEEAGRSVLYGSTLSSDGKKADTAKRELVLLSASLPSQVKIGVNYDPHGQRPKTKTVKKEIALPSDRVGFPTENSG